MSPPLETRGPDDPLYDLLNRFTTSSCLGMAKIDDMDHFNL